MNEETFTNINGKLSSLLKYEKAVFQIIGPTPKINEEEMKHLKAIEEAKKEKIENEKPEKYDVELSFNQLVYAHKFLFSGITFGFLLGFFLMSLFKK